VHIPGDRACGADPDEIADENLALEIPEDRCRPGVYRAVASTALVDNDLISRQTAFNIAIHLYASAIPNIGLQYRILTYNE
jgi:hypothetical protein